MSNSIHLLSGGISGCIGVLALQPLDLIKTRIQQEGNKTSLQVFSTARSVIQADGITGLWRGSAATLYRNVPGVSLYFYSLAELRSIAGQFGFLRAGVQPLGGSKVRLTPLGDALVGSTARSGVGYVLMPFTLLKTLSESTLSVTKNVSTLAAFQAIYKQGGIRSLWRGAVPTAIRDAPGAGLFVLFYERLSSLFPSSGGVSGGLSGSAASLVSTLLTTPFDLIKTRRQIDPNAYPSLLKSMATVYNHGGFFSLWQGSTLRIIRKSASSGIGWAVYESFLAYSTKK